MKKILLTLALFAQLGQTAKADTTLTIEAAQLESSANLEIVVYAYDITTLAVVGQTLPIAVSNSIGDLTIDIEDVDWDGNEPTSNWGWGHAEIKITCATPTTAATANSCGSLNIDGVSVGIITPYQEDDCFESSVNDCGADVGDVVTASLRNSSRYNPKGVPSNIVTITVE